MLMLVLMWTGMVIGCIILLVVVIGFASPRVATISRSVEVNATPEEVFPQLNNLKNFVEHWSPWTAKDPNASHTYNNIPEGTGAQYSWEGDRKKVGAGTMKITESERNKRVRTSLYFKGRGHAFANMHVEASGNGRSKVTWNFEGDNGNNPFGRLMGRFMDKLLGPDYEKGLNNLKAYFG